MKFILFTLFAAIGLSATAQTNEVAKVKVTGDRVSLRTGPDLDSELLDRAMRGEELVFLGKTNGWVAVQAPESLDFWVSGEYVQNGIVVPAKLNIRSGPSQNYSVVFVANKGDAVTLRGEFNKWIKIAPPPGSQVWISEKYTEMIEPPKPEPVPEPEPVVEPVVEKPKPTPASKPWSAIPELTEAERKPLPLVLDTNKEQGIYDEIYGVLRRANPGLYKLVLIEGALEEPICLVRGNENQMNNLLNRPLLLKGKLFWAKDVALPILRVEAINKNPILVE